MTASAKKKHPPPKKLGAPPKAAEALAAVAPELAALHRDQLAVINIDIPQSVSIALGVIDGLKALRPSVVQKLPEHDIAQYDKLETYALAAWYAHLIYLPPAGPASPLKVLLEEAAPLRANLLGDGEALARRGYLDQALLEEIRAGQGHLDLANDLVALSALFADGWDEIRDRTAATEAEINRAAELGPLILAALGVREHGPAPGPTDAADRRARAFTLFVRAYDQARRAVTYLRWDEGDADSFAPSLYRGRGGRGSGGSTAQTAAAGTEAARAPEEQEPQQG